MKPLDPITSRNILEQILSKREYQVYYPKNQNMDWGFLSGFINWVQGLFSKIISFLKDWLDKIMKNINPNMKIPEPLLNTLSYIIFGLGMLIILFFIYLIWKRFVRQKRTKTEKVKIEEMNIPTPKLLLEADQLAAKGEFLSAIRKVFMMVIQYLHENDLIEVKKWKTNWEYYDEIYTHNQEMAGEFQVLALKFDEAMYGGRPINMSDYELYRQQVNRWLQLGMSIAENGIETNGLGGGKIG